MEYIGKVCWFVVLLLSAGDAYQGEENIQSLLQQLEEELVQGGDPQCEDLFRTDLNKIIRTTDSLENKAKFLDSPMQVVDQETCREACCATDGCDTAVYENEEGGADSGRNCYLFGCQGRCFFAQHAGYLSMVKRDPGDLEPMPAEPGVEEVNRLVTSVPTTKAVTTHRVPSTKLPPPATARPHTPRPPPVVQKTPVPQPTQPHVVELRTVKVDPVQPVVVVQPQPEPVQPPECKRWEFQCDDGTCIHMAYVCDSLFQCVDGSDEAVCQGVTRKPEEQRVQSTVETAEEPMEPEPVCEPVRCRMYCAYGWDTDAQGCEICRCKLPEEPINGNGSPGESESTDKNQQPHVKSTQPPKPAEKTDKAAPAPQGKPGVEVKIVEVNISQEKGAPAAPNPATPPPEAQQGKGEPPTKEEEATQVKKGLSATPSHLAPESGAVLPLALGLAVTALLLLVVGCRLRQVKGRLKYGRSLATNAEADYLINGMYL